MGALLAVDPGRDKCGVAVVDEAGGVLHRAILAAPLMEAEFPPLARAWNVERIVLGDATSSQQWAKRLAQWLPDVPITIVDETGSTLEARALYWQTNPPRGWRRWVPLSLQNPPEPIDDFAAVVLAQRFLQM